MNFNFKEIYDRAQKAGLKAGKEHKPVEKMLTRRNKFSTLNQWSIEDGANGFAWIVIIPYNCPFSGWLIQNNLATIGYPEGVNIRITDHRQSYEKKMKHAETMAAIFRQEGINAYSYGRLD